jgi:hypothetical protein
METDLKTPAIEHQNVPTEHRGLHDFLYNSPDEHAEIVNPIAPVALTVDNTVLPLQDWFDLIGDAKIAGVYAVFDRQQQLQYVNISRNVSLSLRGHLTQLGSDLCAAVRVSQFRSPKRDEMTALQAIWIAENVTTPLGNLDPENPWTQTTGDAAITAMTPAEREAYEEKKLKLRKAMADSSLSRETAILEPDADRNANTESAVQNDDWSSVIQTQTQSTL